MDEAIGWVEDLLKLEHEAALAAIKSGSHEVYHHARDAYNAKLVEACHGEWPFRDPADEEDMDEDELAWEREFYAEQEAALHQRPLFAAIDHGIGRQRGRRYTFVVGSTSGAGTPDIPARNLYVEQLSDGFQVVGTESRVMDGARYRDGKRFNKLAAVEVRYANEDRLQPEARASFVGSIEMKG